MRCNDFDVLIEELLTGVLHPEASQHMRQCERCNSYFRARSAVQGGLRALASAPVHGPSLATDRAVMQSYRRLQTGRGSAGPSTIGRVLTFPSRHGVSHIARTRWGSLAVAAALLAMVGSGIHLWTGTPTVTAPSVATAPAVSQSAAAAAKDAPESTASESNMLAAENVSRQPSPRQLQAKLNRPSRSVRPAVAGPVPAAEADQAGPAESSSAPANSIMHLASTGGAAPANGVAQSAGSTWPGYNNLMVCDPVVCSGPMQVVNIKVPASQFRPSTPTERAPGTQVPGAAKAEGDSFVNVEVVVGPDGVARAIRVAN
jgi:hypothetical protein